MKILLVDDEKDLVVTLSALLQKWGYDVVSAHDGIQAQKVLETAPIDIVISDLIMPNLDGGELITWLNTQKKKPHFIIMSAYYNEGFIKYFSDQGITNILGKPIQFDKLQAMLNKFSAQSTILSQTISERQAEVNDTAKEEKAIDVYELITKNIFDRFSEAKNVIVANPSTGKMYSKMPQSVAVVESHFADNAVTFFTSIKSLWKSLSGEQYGPKEILFSDETDRLIYRNIVSPKIFIHIEAPIQTTHGLLRITVDNVVKEISLPVS